MKGTVCLQNVWDVFLKQVHILLAYFSAVQNMLSYYCIWKIISFFFSLNFMSSINLGLSFFLLYISLWYWFNFKRLVSTCARADLYHVTLPPLEQTKEWTVTQNHSLSPSPPLFLWGGSKLLHPFSPRTVNPASYSMRDKKCECKDRASPTLLTANLLALGSV